MAAAGGVTVKVIWDNKDAVLVVRRIGEECKPKHEALYQAAQASGRLGDAYSEIDSLHTKLTGTLVAELINLCCKVVDFSAVGIATGISSADLFDDTHDHTDED